MTSATKTPLYELHISLGARMAPFGGFLMPIQYTGIFKEHAATRENATLFDTCHMGEFHLSGATAIRDLENLLSCPIASMAVGQCRYGLMCNANGGVIDDLIVYRLADAAFMLVVNAGTQDDDFRWIQSHCSASTHLENQSATTAKLDLQGPGAPAIMQAMAEDGIADLRYFRFKQTRYRNEPVRISRTGYTGEVGFEIYTPPALARPFWEEAMERGAVCAGLGARDTLRLEMGMPLYGHELTATRNAAEGAIPRAISSDAPFIGHTCVQNDSKRHDTLVGIRLKGRRAAREGDTILAPDGTPLGVVTSGSFAPSLGVAIALGYIARNKTTSGCAVVLKTSRATLDGTLITLPFYKNATARQPLHIFGVDGT